MSLVYSTSGSLFAILSLCRIDPLSHTVIGAPTLGKPQAAVKGVWRFHLGPMGKRLSRQRSTPAQVCARADLHARTGYATAAGNGQSNVSWKRAWLPDVKIDRGTARLLRTPVGLAVYVQSMKLPLCRPGVQTSSHRPPLQSVFQRKSVFCGRRTPIATLVETCLMQVGRVRGYSV